MTYHDLVAKIKNVFEKADAHGITEHVAVQINIEGEAEGIFYIEVADGSVKVEPYDYRDRDLLIITSAATLTEIAEGRITGVEAAESGRLRAEGNFEKAGQLRVLDVQKVEPVTESEKEEEEEEFLKAEPAASESTEAVEEEMPVTESSEKADEPPKAEQPAGETPVIERAEMTEESTAAEGTAEEEKTEQSAEEKPVAENIEKEEQPAEEEKADEPPKTDQTVKTPAGRQMSRKQRKKWKKKKNG